ncbi:MAG: HIT domain-containing protein [Fimbriimonadia bacterium]
MERIWAPWRLEYVEVAAEQHGCIFCEKPAAQADEENLILFRGKTAFVILNLYPYSNGHLMVAPYKHAASLTELSEPELLELITLTRDATEWLKRAYHPSGMNIGMNLGRVAGAGIEGHIHMHVVPRWAGDTNFMAVLGDTRVIPEGLRRSYERLKEAIGE